MKIYSCLLMILLCFVPPLHGMYEAILNRLNQQVVEDKLVNTEKLSEQVREKYYNFFEKITQGTLEKKFFDLHDAFVKAAIADKNVSNAIIKNIENMIDTLLTDTPEGWGGKVDILIGHLRNITGVFLNLQLLIESENMIKNIENYIKERWQKAEKQREQLSNIMKEWITFLYHDLKVEKRPTTGKWGPTLNSFTKIKEFKQRLLASGYSEKQFKEDVSECVKSLKEKEEKELQEENIYQPGEPYKHETKEEKIKKRQLDALLRLDNLVEKRESKEELDEQDKALLRDSLQVLGVVQDAENLQKYQEIFKDFLQNY